MAGIELAGALHDRSRLGQLPSPGLRACLLQQIAQGILAPLQRRQIVRLHCQDALEQRQCTAVAIIKPPRRKGIARLCQQRADAGPRVAARLQLAGNRFGFALRHLQLAGQRQCLYATVEIVVLQPVACLLQCRRSGSGQAFARLRAITVQCQHRLVALACATAIGRAQPARGECAVTLGQQLFDLRLIPEPVGQRLAQQHQQHEHGQRRDQRPAPDPARVACLQPPPAAFAADAVQRRMFSAMRAMRRLAFHACRVAGAA
ncbi:hypothetical protein G6F22_009106 [Rhizopus arrhizus]|nr:hypothetical protein G6F22_009106 [Rhizopus arrhizus]KAG1202874.1 hypothetical protein G6F35_012139 [Rhizopus arrhizus]